MMYNLSRFAEIQISPLFFGNDLSPVQSFMGQLERGGVKDPILECDMNDCVFQVKSLDHACLRRKESPKTFFIHS